MFYTAVRKNGRKKLIMAALWTEACLSFLVLDALKEGFEVYAVADAAGGMSLEVHHAALRRIEQAGAQLIAVNQLLCESQCDWNGSETVDGFAEVLFKEGKSIKAKAAYRKSYVTIRIHISLLDEFVKSGIKYVISILGLG